MAMTGKATAYGRQGAAGVTELQQLCKYRLKSVIIYCALECDPSVVWPPTPI